MLKILFFSCSNESLWSAEPVLGGIHKPGMRNLLVAALWSVFLLLPASAQDSPPALGYCSPDFSAPNTYILVPARPKEIFKSHNSHLEFDSENLLRLVSVTIVVCAKDGTPAFRYDVKNTDLTRLSRRHKIDIEVVYSDIKNSLKKQNEFKVIVQTDRPSRSQPSIDFQK